MFVVYWWGFAIMIVGYLVNIPFFIRWAKRQQGKGEIAMYYIRGKYTYFNVLDQIFYIEEQTGKQLKTERQKIVQIKTSSDEKGVPFYKFQKQVFRMLKEAAFEKPMMISAWNRMDFYPKLVALWDLLIVFGFLHLFVPFLKFHGFPIMLSGILGNFAGIVFGAPLWLILHLTLNLTLRRAAKRALKSTNEIGYLHLLMVQFWAFWGGVLWQDAFFVEKKNHFAAGPDIFGK